MWKMYSGIASYWFSLRWPIEVRHAATINLIYLINFILINLFTFIINLIHFQSKKKENKGWVWLTLYLYTCIILSSYPISAHIQSDLVNLKLKGVAKKFKLSKKQTKINK